MHHYEIKFIENSKTVKIIINVTHRMDAANECSAWENGRNCLGEINILNIEL